VDGSGVEPTSASDVDVGLVKTDQGQMPCLMLAERRVYRSEESSEWTSVQDLDFHKPVIQDDDRYAFPLSFLVDPASIQVTHENGRISITVTAMPLKPKLPNR